MKAVIKNVTIDNENDELVLFAQTLEFDELFDHVKSFLKVNCTFYQPEITTKSGRVYVSFMSDDITDQTGPFAAILERCCVHSFSNGIFKDNESGEPCYWVSVSIRYDHKDGGSNGMEALVASYRDGKWGYSDAGQKS